MMTTANDMRRTMKPTKSQGFLEGRTRVSLFEGIVLCRVADTYPHLHDCLMEYVQNAIDSDAKRIRLKIDLEERFFEIVDDGEGASKQKVDLALSQVGRSLKKPGKYGKYGIGMVSALGSEGGKCESFTFTSCSEDDPLGVYRQWTFVTKHIQKMREVDIPFIERTDLEYHPDPESVPSRSRPKDKALVWWRTQVRVKGIVKDRVVSSLNVDDLVHDISIKYGEEIRKRQIDLTVRFTSALGKTEVERQVVASEFTGEPLEEFMDSTPTSGRMICQLHLARNTSKGRNGEVLFSVMGDPYRLTFSQFVKCTSDIIGDDVESVRALGSGIFEGLVTCEKILLQPNRKSFVQNDALLDMCCSIVRWYKAVGEKYVLEVRSKEKETRWQALGLRSIKFVKALLKLPEYSDILSKMQLGNIGIGHKKLRKVGEDDQNVLALQGGAGGSKEEGEDPKTRDRDEPKDEKDGHHPVTVAGPRGRPRVSVRDSSTGIEFRYVEFESTLVPFEFVLKTGTLNFNVRHPFWSQCSELDTSLMRYQEAVVQMALALARFEGSAYAEQQRAVVLDLLKMQVFAILKADALTGRRRSGNK